MARKPVTGGKTHLPELELECIKVLWDLGDLTVRGVRDRLLPRRPLAYTTVLTLLDRLARKGAVTRRKSGRAHLYHPVYTRAEAREAALQRLLEHYFDGSPRQLIEHLASAGGWHATAARAAAASAAAEDSAEDSALDPTLL